jgi:hypothetical protein
LVFVHFHTVTKVVFVCFHTTFFFFSNFFEIFSPPFDKEK